MRHRTRVQPFFLTKVDEKNLSDALSTGTGRGAQAGGQVRVCHERRRKPAMLYRRWESASRNRLAGAGSKPPSAAAFKRRCRERLWKRRRLDVRYVLRR